MAHISVWHLRGVEFLTKSFYSIFVNHAPPHTWSTNRIPSLGKKINVRRVGSYLGGEYLGSNGNVLLHYIFFKGAMLRNVVALPCVHLELNKTWYVLPQHIFGPYPDIFWICLLLLTNDSEENPVVHYCIIDWSSILSVTAIFGHKSTFQPC